MRGLLLLLCLAAFLGCDRHIEPFVPGEQPRQPDLSKIFPAGAEQVAQMSGDIELPAPPGAPAAMRQGPDNTANAEPIRGVVRVSPQVDPRLATGGVLFLIARRGPGPPVAVQRFADPSFPLEFSIGPQDRMIEGIPFVGPLELEARLDRDGEATSRGPDDLEGRAAGGHEPGASGVEIVLAPRGSAPQMAAAPAAGAPVAAAGQGGEAIRGVVRVAPELEDRLPAGGVLFLIARVGAGGPPLAVQRVASPHFPLEFSIGPEDRMIKARPFAGSIQLSARLDLDGNAVSRSPGDLQGSARSAHSPGDQGVEIVLDQLL